MSIVDRALIKFDIKQPIIPWLNYPMTVQIDTTNVCGKASGIKCEYCFPQWMVECGQDHHAYMPMNWIHWIQDDIATNMPRLKGFNLWNGNNPPAQFIAYFLNGCPQNESDSRFKEIMDYHLEKLPWLQSQIFTSATHPERVKKFSHEGLNWICVTCSAPNAEIYKKVHGGDKFNDVIKSMEYLDKNRLPNQRLEVHYVITENNFQYIREWFDFMGQNFPKWKRVFSALVKSPDNEPSVKALGRLTVEEQENAIVDKIGKEYLFWKRDQLGFNQPCVLHGNAAITVHGTIMQCCNWSKTTWNYGSVEEYMSEGRSLKDYWTERLANKQRNIMCRNCNLRHPDYKQRMANTKFSTSYSEKNRTETTS